MKEKHIIIGTAGHVDHGKTSLIKSLTNVDCDTHQQEKDRGITINLGFSHLELASGNSVGIVDMPGHRDFIKTMVAGAYGIDLVLLVIAADSGIMPQTREHLNIIRMLDINDGIIVLTKTDLVDDEMLELAELEIQEFLEESPLDSAEIVKVSNVDGRGVDELRQRIDAFCNAIVRTKSKEGFRLYVDRLFNVRGIGIVVTGSVINGELCVGDELYALPEVNKKVKVKGIQRHGKVVDSVSAGDRAAINISGIKTEDYHKGLLLSSDDIAVSQLIDCRIRLFDEKAKLKVWTGVIFLSGTFECLAKVHLLDVDELTNGGEALVQIHLSKPYPFLPKDRFILRNSSNDLTLGGGIIFNTQPLHHRRRTEKLKDIIQEQAQIVLDDSSISDKIRMVLKTEKSPFTLKQMAEKIDVEASEIIQEFEAYSHSDIISNTQSDEKVLFSGELLDEVKMIILEALHDYHEKNPMIRTGLLPGSFVNKGVIRDSALWKLILNHALTSLESETKIKKVKETFTLYSHKVKINAKAREQIEWLEQKIIHQGMQNPRMRQIEEWAKDNKISKDRFRSYLQYLVAENKLVIVDGEYVHRALTDKALGILLKETAKKGTGLNEKELREATNATKKFVQTLVKLFVDEGIITKRNYYLDLTEKGERLQKES